MALIPIPRRDVLGSMVGALSLGLGRAWAADQDDTWATLKSQFFGDRPIVDDGAFSKLVAPIRAEDAALVPIDIHLAAPGSDGQAIDTITLLVDENPSPLVAKLLFPGGTTPFDLSTRIRVNSYSFVRVVAETGDGALHMSKAYVKAAGGCSAPAGRDPAEAKAEVGKMRFRVFTDTGRDEAQLQIRHPNYSGMQMDQVTRLYTPAWFIEHLEIKQGDRILFAMEGGISLSEDPTFRFTYKSNGQPVSAYAKDSEGNVFRHAFPAAGGA